jgi:hypothetical protein
MKAGLIFCTRFIVLCTWHLVSLMIAALVVGSFISLADPGQPSVDLLPLLVVSILETAVMVWVISRLKLTGIKLLVVTLIIFHGVKVFLMMIELAFFLNIWASPAMISLERVFGLELHGLLMALLFCPVAILVMRKWSAKEQSLTAIFPSLNRSLVIRILGVSALYSVCYWLAGSYLLIPIAGGSFTFTYSHLQVPVWMPLFQVGRGLLWALIVLLLVRHLVLQGARLYLAVGVILAVLGSAQLLAPNPYMLDHLRYAHMLEIAVSMMVFGFLASWILQPERLSVRKS